MIASGRATSRELVLLAGLKLLVTFVLLASGFQGISDDDFARVVIAQDFAHAPKLDPSGTSWLPFPFWLNGLVMMVLGPTLSVARAVAVLLGVASVLLARVAAGWITNDRASAFTGAVAVAVLPWSVRLGASTVPELPTAALSLLAIAALVVPRAPGRLLAGGAALFAATLSRYEPWFIAIGFIVALAAEALRERRLGGERIAAAALAAAGPLGWTAWNAHAHGSALHYLDRVAAYKQAVDQGAIFERVFAYVFAVFRAEPELLVLAIYLAVRVALSDRTALWATLRPFARPAAVLGFLFLTLTASSVKGGAPTHHAERALLVVHLTMALAGGALLAQALQKKAVGSRLALFAFIGLAAPALYILRAWYLYKESYAERRDEVAIGQEVQARVPETERVLVEVIDYGFYAIEAGSARPWSFALSAPIHPSKPVERLSIDALGARATEESATWFVAESRNADSESAAVVCRGRWCLHKVP